MTCPRPLGEFTDEPPVTLSVIAPCFNEQDNIDPLVDRTLTTFDSLGVQAELVLVDDCSTDRTWERMLARRHDDHRVRVVQHTRNQGMESAWKTGLSNARGQLACIIDADLQNRPEDIASLYDAYKHGHYDIIQAVRHAVKGVTRMAVFSRGLNLLLNVSFGMKQRDNKSGFLLCRRTVLQAILHHRFKYRYFQCFVGVSAGQKGYTIGEVDTVFERRNAGESFLADFPLRVSVRTAWELLKFRIETMLFSIARSEPKTNWSPVTDPATSEA